MQPVSPSLANVDRIVIVCPSWVGDCVMATPVYRAVRQALPKVKTVAAVRKGLDEVLQGSPWFDEIIVSDMKGLLGPLRLAKAIRGDGTGAVLLLPNSFRAGLGARLSRIPLRIGYQCDGRGWLLTHKLLPPTTKAPISAVNYYATLAAFALNISADAFNHRIELGMTEAQHHKADELLQDVQGDFILLNPGANRADKRWPAERFARVADTLASSHHGLSIVVNGSANEREVIDEVLAAAKTPLIDLSKRGGTLGSLKAVIARAKLVLTNDTGPRHIAAALGTPVMTLFGPTDHRWTTLQGAQERILLAEPFLPEQLIADRHAKACAIEKISVGDVVNAVEEFLRIRQPKEAASGRG